MATISLKIYHDHYVFSSLLIRKPDHRLRPQANYPRNTLKFEKLL